MFLLRDRYFLEGERGLLNNLGGTSISEVEGRMWGGVRYESLQKKRVRQWMKKSVKSV